MSPYFSRLQSRQETLRPRRMKQTPAPSDRPRLTVTKAALQVAGVVLLWASAPFALALTVAAAAVQLALDVRFGMLTLYRRELCRDLVIDGRGGFRWRRSSASCADYAILGFRPGWHAQWRNVRTPLIIATTN